jgi:hypothetical protein
MNSVSAQTQQHSADKPSGSGVKPELRIVSSSSKPQMSIEERAMKYLEKLPDAVSGQSGHDRFFHAACVLIIGFNMNIDQARPVLQWFNTNKCVPPFSERDIEHKLESADRKSDERGTLLSEQQSAQVRPSAPARPLAKPMETKESPSLVVSDYIEDMIAGKHFCADWPWTAFGNLTKALKPGTITIISAPQGTSKSLFVLQAVTFWVISRSYQVAILELEEDRSYHLLRALAQLSQNANITDDAWVRDHPDETRAAWERHSKTLDKLGAVIWEGPTEINTESVIAWLQAMVVAEKRIIVIDPISARDPSERPWIDDHRFMARAKDILKPTGSSLVLVTHPPKGKVQDEWGGDVEGGKAFLKFSQTIVYMRGMPEPKMMNISMPHGCAEMEVNRKIELKKTRNGKGWFATIGMYLNPKTLLHEERGIIVK